MTDPIRYWPPATLSHPIPLCSSPTAISDRRGHPERERSYTQFWLRCRINGHGRTRTKEKGICGIEVSPNIATKMCFLGDFQAMPQTRLTISSSSSPIPSPSVDKKRSIDRMPPPHPVRSASSHGAAVAQHGNRGRSERRHSQTFSLLPQSPRLAVP